MKRIKLFSSLGALAVAICVLAFGVYAATTVTYNINATVTYSFSDALVEVTSTIYKYDIENPTTAADLTTAIDGVSAVEVSKLVVRSYDASANNKPCDPTIITPAVGVTIDENKQINDARDFNFNDALLYKVVIQITTPAGDGVAINYILPQVNTANATNGKVFVQAAATGNFESGTRLAKTETATITYYIGILAIDTSIGNTVPLVAGSLAFTN